MKAHLLAAFTVFAWGITFVSTKVLLVDFSPMHILFIRFALGFMLAMSGVAVVSLASGGSAGADTTSNLIGCGLALGAACVWAAYSTTVDRIAGAGYETLASTKRIFGWGLLFMMPMIPFGGALPDISALASPVNAGNLLFLGLVASAACFATWGFAVKHLGPVTTSTYIYLVPAITAATSVIILGEPFTATIAAGLVLTIAGLVISNR
ncbi:DMT family transporter [Adlercreutzia sp. R25]|uniref:DMT family transporter n=1 Tax=Adlercreutzia shanghongiae TaxID=3111773 RepID=UPI002DBF5CF1|nr:DMT family transporter [Adlercreutzia sp. R25]MEC4273131.1 DMT family transporter [Adlercreutzia sp. R25]